MMLFTFTQIHRLPHRIRPNGRPKEALDRISHEVEVPSRLLVSNPYGSIAQTLTDDGGTNS